MSPELSLTLACLNIPLRNKILKNPFEVAEGLFSFFLILLQADKGQQTLSTRGNYLSYISPFRLIWTQSI
jgi:hypothetical protein